MQCLQTRLKHDDLLNPASRSPVFPHLPVPHFADKTETADMADMLETIDLTFSPLLSLALQLSPSSTEADAESCHKRTRMKRGSTSGAGVLVGRAKLCAPPSYTRARPMDFL
jgi:hypothetical protein